LAERFEEARSDPALLELRDDIALLDSRLGEMVESLGEVGSADLWRMLRVNYEALRAARSTNNVEGMALALSAMGELIERGDDVSRTWDQVFALLDQRRKLVESERKRLVEMHQMITVERAMILIQAVMNAVAQRVRDRDTLRALATDVRAIVGGEGR
jgi:hypothetical protein